MHQTILQFPEIRLERRDGHKLRGYFANTFGQESDLFHNHDQEGRNIYRYPRIQYKVIRGVPMLVGINEGASMIVNRFLEMKSINIDGLHIPLHQKNLTSGEQLVRVNGSLESYEFITPWLALNQKNHNEYIQLNKEEKKAKLTGILKNNILTFCKGINYRAEEQIMVHIDLKEPKIAKFKNQPMLTFMGSFVCNMQLPDYVGLGKSVARGYGTIKRK